LTVFITLTEYYNIVVINYTTTTQSPSFFSIILTMPHLYATIPQTMIGEQNQYPFCILHAPKSLSW